MKTHRLRAYLSILGVVAAVGLAIGAAVVWHGGFATAGSNGSGDSSPPEATGKQVPVVLTPARVMTFQDRIVVSGSVLAEKYALVSARIPGTLDAVYVDEGDRVEAGKTRLFQTDSLKLAKAVAIAMHDLTVAESSVQEKQALLEKDLAAQEQAGNDLKRYQQLLQRNAIAAQVVEQQASQCKECNADVKHSQALIALANARLEQTRLNLTIAQKDLTDSLVLAPINGRVSQRLREPGEMAAAGTPVLRIEDLSVLEVSVFLPEECYVRVLPGKTKMQVKVGNVDLGEPEVSYKSPTVHSKLRTFEVKGLVESPPEGVVPGCLAEVAIVTASRAGVGVPAGAVQSRGGQEVVFSVSQGRAKMIPVATGREMQGWCEILDGLSAGVSVISMGQFLVEEGTLVSVVQEDVR